MKKIKAKEKSKKVKGRNIWAGLLAFTFSFFLFPFSLHATPTQEEVFRSINDNVGQSADPTKLLAGVLVIVGVIVVIVLFNQRAKRPATIKSLAHPGRLIKEIARSVNLKPAEVKQLKVLAEGQDVDNPLTLLLCPSLLTKAVKEDAGKIDRRALASLVQKMGHKW